LQAQFFNVFNNTTFSTVGTTLSSPSTFGYYSGTDTNSRRIALAGGLTWQASFGPPRLKAGDMIVPSLRLF
jgi:hypothetical protein